MPCSAPEDLQCPPRRAGGGRSFFFFTFMTPCRAFLSLSEQPAKRCDAICQHTLHHGPEESLHQVCHQMKTSLESVTSAASAVVLVCQARSSDTCTSRNLRETLPTQTPCICSGTCACLFFPQSSTIFLGLLLFSKRLFTEHHVTNRPPPLSGHHQR